MRAETGKRRGYAPAGSPASPGPPLTASIDRPGRYPGVPLHPRRQGPALDGPKGGLASARGPLERPARAPSPPTVTTIALLPRNQVRDPASAERVATTTFGGKEKNQECMDEVVATVDQVGAEMGKTTGGASDRPPVRDCSAVLCWTRMPGASVEEFS